MSTIDEITTWQRGLGIADHALARFMGVSPWTVRAWKRKGKQHRTPPEDWRQLVARGLIREAREVQITSDSMRAALEEVGL